jgi:hypothetical protein
MNMRSGLFGFIKSKVWRPEPPLPIPVPPTQVFDECLPGIEDYALGCRAGIYALSSDDLVFGAKPTRPDLMGLRSRYDRESDRLVTVIGVPGRLPIGLLFLLHDLNFRSRDSTLARLLIARGTNGARYFGDGLGQRMHPLLHEARDVAEVVAEQARGEADVMNIRAYAYLFCDMADSFRDVRFSGCMAVCDATAELLESPLRHSAKEASHAYLHHLVEHLTKRLEQAVPGQFAERMLIVPSFRAIAIVETDASAF